MRKYAAAFLVICVLILCACQTAPQYSTQEIFAMDTYMTLRVYDNEEVTQTLCQKIFSLEQLLSATSENSQLYQLNHTGCLRCSEELLTLLRQSLALCERTQGAFDISIYPVVALWGFPTDQFRVPSPEELQNALQTVGASHIRLLGDTVTLDKGSALDFGAVAKGYAGRLCTELLAASKAKAAILSLGGNIQTYGTKPDGDWVVGIADPTGADDYFASLRFTGTHAVVTSGSYQRYFEQDGKTYHHILDPKTGQSVDNGLLSVTVMCDDGLLADGLSTALFVMGLEKSTEFYRQSDDFEAVFYLQDGTVYITKGLISAYSGKEYEVIGR